MKIDWKKIWGYWTPANVGSWFSALGGRRFLISVGAGAVTSVLSWFQKITPEIYRDVILGTVGAYILGNTVQKVKQATGQTTVQVAEITGEAPVTNNIGTSGQPVKVELSSKDGTLGY